MIFLSFNPACLDIEFIALDLTIEFSVRRRKKEEKE
jgi:hypothetical protein